MALRIEQVLTKDRILELYLNEIYLGGGSYGVAAAALQYFNRPLDELTIAEAAFLGALPKAPSNYNPARFPEAAKARRDWVIDRMVDAGFISAADGVAAREGPVRTRKRDETEVVTASYFSEEIRRDLLARYGEKGLYQSGLQVRSTVDPVLQATSDRVLRAGLIAYDRRHGWRGPVGHLDGPDDGYLAALAAMPAPPGIGDWRLAVVMATAADGAAIALQNGEPGRIAFDELKWARPTLENQRLGPVPKTPADVIKAGDVILVEQLAPADAKKPAAYGLRQIPAVSGAFVAMDPHTGRVLAMSGGFSYEISQFNRATQAKRQPGSSFKPFAYLAALDNGFTPTTLILDAPIVLDQGPGLPPWKPSNYDAGKFSGPTPLRAGVEQSKNLMTIRLAQVVGMDKIGDVVERFGIMDRMPRHFSMVLGAGETTLMRLTAAYGMLVNGGKKITPTVIDRIQDRQGVSIVRSDTRPCVGCRDVEWKGQEPPVIPDTREQVADARSAYQMVSILQGVVERGTGTVVAAVKKPLAGKTGTTNDYQDNWFVGFSPDLVAGVYIGFDTPRSLGERETGGGNAAPIFRDFMMEALKDKPATPFRIPPGLRLVRINPATGQPAKAGDKGVIYEAFKPGTEFATRPVVAGESLPDDETGTATDTSGEAPQVAPASGTGGLY